jgi:2-keto-4-pentenoate hydratase/2-oxohepta-3-ene-1,7-dioic acid hydratase in catechol pathway
VEFRLGTFSVTDGVPFAGLVVGERAVALSSVDSFLRRAGSGLNGSGSVLALLQDWAANFAALERAAHAMTQGAAPELVREAVAVQSLVFHPPVNLPRQIFCSGANYKKHVVDIIVAQAMEETKHMNPEERRAYGTQKMEERAAKGTPFFFVKAQSTVSGARDPLVLPDDVKQPDWELELGVVIGRAARRVPRGRALEHVAGYVVVNDITSRERVNRRPGDMREMGMDWVASKCSPGYLPMGPYLVPAQFVGDPQALQVTLKLNGQTMQDESTADMIFGVARLIEDLSRLVLLQPGDLICTGSPSGNGIHHGRLLRPGDVIEGTITGLGTQRNECVAEGSA